MRTCHKVLRIHHVNHLCHLHLDHHQVGMAIQMLQFLLCQIGLVHHLGNRLCGQVATSQWSHQLQGDLKGRGREMDQLLSLLDHLLFLLQRLRKRDLRDLDHVMILGMVEYDGSKDHDHAMIHSLIHQMMTILMMTLMTIIVEHDRDHVTNLALDRGCHRTHQNLVLVRGQEVEAYHLLDLFTRLLR